MKNRAFKLQQVKIEGFKGFTESRIIPVSSKHLFILGPNSYGKSSIVEGIRWGLFGSTRRRDEIVSNQSYQGSCRVELQLERDDGIWTLKRALIKGASGGSDAAIVDQDGQSHLLGEVMPQLESAPAGEGMHIVYAAQSAPLKRSVKDLTPFERTIFSYLGLTEVRMAISVLDNFIEIHEETERQLAERVDEESKRIDSELSRLTELRHRIIEAPPWGDGNVPTQVETTKKITAFIQELSSMFPAEAISSVDIELGALLSELESLFERTAHIKTSEIEVLISDNQQSLQQLRLHSNELHQLKSQLECLDNQSAAAREKLAELLEDQAIDELVHQVNLANSQVKETALLLEIKQKSREWLQHIEPDSGKGICPVCEEQSEITDLLSNLDERISTASSQEAEIITKRDELLQKSNLASTFIEEIRGMELSRATLEQRIKELEVTILGLIGASIGGGETDLLLKEYIEQLENTIQILEKRLSEASTIEKEWKHKLELFREEISFHRLQDQLVEVQKQNKQLNAVQNNLNTLSLFADSVRIIEETVREELNNALKRALPSINNQLTKAFQDLTEHPAYNRVFIDESQLPKLELRVSSDDSPLSGWEPAQVLNGQALNALELVPYFAFSELTEMPFEVYLLLLDDPTQSFDGHHISILVEKLAELGKRVQLVVASHESDYFQQLVSKYFKADEYEIVRVTGFSRLEGPSLELSNGG